MKPFAITILLMYFFLISTSKLFPIENELFIDLRKVDKNAIKKEHLGVFFEYIYNKVNGKFGMSAQEIQDRGFDTELYGMSWEKHQYWFLYHTCSADSIIEMKPWCSGYNKKGLRHYAINKEAKEGVAGFEQEILLDSGKTYDFYVYAMGTVDSVYLEFIDRQGDILFQQNLGALTKDWSWQKLSCQIPMFDRHHSCKIRIYTKSPGYLHLDESSLMATDNQYTLRKEFVDMLRELKPGLMRFPGGSFCDYSTWHFYDHIGDRDQRRAPNYWPNDNEILRMDFGLDEYFKLCRDLDIEPYITTNYKTGTLQEALNLLEYCNGDTSTTWGNKRAENGNPETIGVRFFEIGNEQWEVFSPEYPVEYLKYYNEMKKKDSTIEILVNGFHWDGEKEINRIFSIVQHDANYFSWHPGYASLPSKKLNEIDEYNLFAYGSVITQNDINWITKALGKYGQNIKQAPTEYWTQFMDMNDWITDSSTKGSTLLSGIGDINFLHTFVRNWETTGPACRTMFLTFFFADTTRGGKRVIFASPGYYALKMFFNSHGSDYVDSKLVKSEKGYAPESSNINYFDGTPIFDVVTTKSNDSLFIAILNRSIDSPKNIIINIPGFKYGSKVRFQQLTSDSYYDRNSADEPFKIVPKEFFEQLDSQIVLPKHSYTIISIPLNYVNTTIDIFNNSLDDDIEIYPNPRNSILDIQTNLHIPFDIEIWDLLGNLVKSYASNHNSRIKLNLNDLPQGIYILKFNSNNKNYHKKIIKLD